ncbi:hypothetical protein [Sphingobium sp. YR768]|uniref:hypothetical protein n=1 Tax=Sphingobium sp. YR768 TaxID=1884365 RepID=UPI000B88EC08
MIELVGNDCLPAFIDMDVPDDLLSASPHLAQSVHLSGNCPHHLGGEIAVLHRRLPVGRVPTSGRHFDRKTVSRVHLHA